MRTQQRKEERVVVVRDMTNSSRCFCLSYSTAVYQRPQCLKITEKVSFNIASEASYVYILSKFIKNGQFGEFLKPEATCLTVLPELSLLIGQKLVGKAK